MVDESAVADAIVLRAMARVVIPEQPFRSTTREPRIRSFRREREAKSFRLCSTPRLRHVGH